MKYEAFVHLWYLFECTQSALCWITHGTRDWSTQFLFLTGVCDSSIWNQRFFFFFYHHRLLFGHNLSRREGTRREFGWLTAVLKWCKPFFFFFFTQWSITRSLSIRLVHQGKNRSLLPQFECLFFLPLVCFSPLLYRKYLLLALRCQCVGGRRRVGSGSLRARTDRKRNVLYRNTLPFWDFLYLLCFGSEWKWISFISSTLYSWNVIGWSFSCLAAFINILLSIHRNKHSTSSRPPPSPPSLQEVWVVSAEGRCWDKTSAPWVNRSVKWRRWRKLRQRRLTLTWEILVRLSLWRNLESASGSWWSFADTRGHKRCSSLKGSDLIQLHLSFSLALSLL